jgi:hypothetical protein
MRRSLRQPASPRFVPAARLGLFGAVSEFDSSSFVRLTHKSREVAESVSQGSSPEAPLVIGSRFPGAEAEIRHGSK